MYRHQEKLRAKGKVDPSTGRVHRKMGMATCCRQIEKDNSLEPGSISKSSMGRWLKAPVLPLRPGRLPVLPMDLEENLIKLVLACDARGDEKASPMLVRLAVGLYIKGSAYEKEFRERYPGRWMEERGVILPGKKWLKNWEKRIMAMPKYKHVVKCRGQGLDVDKLR